MHPAMMQVMVPPVGVLEVMVWFLPEDPGKSIRNSIVVGVGGGEGAVGDAPGDGATGDADGEGDAMVDGATGAADGEGAAGSVTFDGAPGDVDGEGAAGGDGSGCRSARGQSMACFGREPSPLLAEDLAGVACRFVCRSWRWLSSPVLWWLLANLGGGRR